MAKQERIDPDLKPVIHFSDLNSLEEGLGIALGQKWSEVSINDVPEDKIEFVKKWVKEKQSQHRDINIHIGRTYIRDWVIIFSSIDELKEGLNRAVKENLREIIIDDVPEDKIEDIEDWIKKIQGEYEDINIRIGSTYTGLHPDEKKRIKNKVGADYSFFDDATLHLEENGEKLFFGNWIDFESPQKRINRIEREINRLQRTNEFKGIAKEEKKKIELELEYLKQLLDHNKIENVIFDQLKKQTEKTLEAHAKRGKGSRRDADPLNLLIGGYDKYLASQSGKHSASEVARWFEPHIIKDLEEYGYFIINVRNEDDNLEYWKTVRGERKKMTASWEHMYKRVYRARNNRKKEAKIKK